jgi:3-deoxy-7-phosphoheptulonate synthase
VHPNPADALSDGGQSLKPERFAELITQVKAITEAMGRRLAHQPAIPAPAALVNVPA